MLDVEVVVLDERVDGPSQRQALGERLAQVVGEQRAVFLGDPLALREHGVVRARDVLAGLEAPDIRADGADRQPGVVDPGALIVVEAVPVREAEPRVLRRVEVGQPAGPGLAPGQSGTERLLVGCALDGSGHAELDRQAGESLELLVRPQDEQVDRRHHLRDRLVRDVRKRLPADLVEDEVGPVSEGEELEVVLPHAVVSFEQAVPGDEQEVGRADRASLGDDGLVLERRQLRHDQGLELADRRLDLLHPALVQLVPVPVVVASPPREQLRAVGQRLRVVDRVRADVDVPVEDPVLGPERGRCDEEAGLRLVQGGNRVVEPHAIERAEGLRAVQRVPEPEASLVEGAALLAEQAVVRVHLLPALAGRWDRHLERAREPSALRFCRHRR